MLDDVDKINSCLDNLNNVTLSDDVTIQDDWKNLAMILGGIALSASQSKKEIETSKTSKMAKNALKGVGLTLASIVGAGGAIANYIEKVSKSQK